VTVSRSYGEDLETRPALWSHCPRQRGSDQVMSEDFHDIADVLDRVYREQDALDASDDGSVSLSDAE